MPAICAKVEFGEIKEDSKRYISWFDKYAIEKFTFKVNRIPDGKLLKIITIDGKTCYKLRCAVLHTGNFGIKKCKYEKIIIHAHNQNSEIYESELIDGPDAHFDIHKFCNSLCEAVEEYYDSFEDKSKFDIENVVVLDW